ncbi:MAG: OmpA family protein, partial [Bradyrhizobium sp.]|nr:OmpA family protein [Bradyrhizobium sp.]
MSKLRVLLLATTALSAMQLTSSGSYAQGTPMVVAQGSGGGEVGPDGRPKQQPQGQPQRPGPGAPPPHQAAPPPPPAPPPAAAPRPAPPPPAPPPAAA